MKTVVFIVLTLTLYTKCQYPNQRIYYNTAANPSSVYFDENRPYGEKTNAEKINRNAEKDKQAYEQVTPIVPTENSYLNHQIDASTEQSFYIQKDVVLKPGQTYGLREPSQDLVPPNQEGNTFYNQNFMQMIPKPSEFPVSYQSVNNISVGITEFGLNMLNNIDHAVPSNVVLSPFSLATLLALLQQGATGESQQEISRALKMSPEFTAQAFKTLTETVQKRGSGSNILKSANRIFASNFLQLNPGFKQVAIQNFGSDVTSTNFGKSAAAVREINKWIAENTLNKITNLVTEDAVDELTEIVLANAVFFKGIWQMKFSKERTLPDTFYLGKGGSKIVPYMRARRHYKAGVDKSTNAQVLILPFERDQYSLVVILPSKSSSLRELTSSLTATQLNDYQKFDAMDVEVDVPKFTVRADTDLNEVLHKMGVSKIFTQDSGLSHLGQSRGLTPQISAALHSAVLSIDEEGGTAAGASVFAAVTLSNDSPDMFFKADRPFLAVLWDNKLSLPLFLAKIEDPSS